MEQGKKNGPLCGNTATTKEAGTDLTAEIVASFDAAVKRHDLPTVLALAGYIPKEAATLLKKRFPKFDKTILSKCSRPDKYGCVLHPLGYSLLRDLLDIPPAPESVAVETAPPPRKPRKSSGHRYKCRVAGRLPDAKYKLLQRYIRLEGYETTQDFVVAQVDAFIEKMEAKYRKD